VKLRFAEITPAMTTAPASRPVQGLREISAVWESADLTDAASQVSIPSGIAKSGHTYRVRARMKDTTGRWSHWSAPVEFVAKD
jgi:hypothetical protein